MAAVAAGGVMGRDASTPLALVAITLFLAALVHLLAVFA